jgi:hypothetical protein
MINPGNGQEWKIGTPPNKFGKNVREVEKGEVIVTAIGNSIGNWVVPTQIGNVTKAIECALQGLSKIDDTDFSSWQFEKFKNSKDTIEIRPVGKKNKERIFAVVSWDGNDPVFTFTVAGEHSDL